MSAHTAADTGPAAAHDVYRYYELAKRREWQTRDLPWGDVSPIPESRGSKERQERRRSLWRSVITQQLQADALAVEMAAQLLELAPDHDAKLYYSTMAQDEARHVEAWLRLAHDAGGAGPGAPPPPAPPTVPPHPGPPPGKGGPQPGVFPG